MPEEHTTTILVAIESCKDCGPWTLMNVTTTPERAEVIKRIGEASSETDYGNPVIQVFDDLIDAAKQYDPEPGEIKDVSL